MGAPTLIETPRLCLRPPTLADAEAIFEEYAQDPSVTKYLSWRPHREIRTVRAFISDLVEAMNHGLRKAWVIAMRGTDRPIGMIDFHIERTRVMAGYVLARKCWGRGYMFEALTPTIDWTLSKERVHRVWAFCDVENRGSARVLEKVGMAREGILRKWFVHPNISEVPRDCYSYSRVKDDT